jgi:putative membrane protein
MKLGSLVALLLGVVAITALVAWVGADAVAGALLVAGVSGVIAITAFNAVTITICALAWRSVVDPEQPRALPLMIWVRFLRGSLSEVVPIGGELVAIRVLTLQGARAGAAGASTVVDLTVELASQIGFTALGLLLLALDGRANAMLHWCLLGLGITSAAFAGFVVVQRRGVFRWIERLPHRLAEHLPWARLPELEGLHQEIQRVYRRPRAVVLGLLWHSLGWIAGVGEASLALWLLDAPLPFASVLIIESLAFALKSTAFAIPAALGVQELGYVALGSLFGLGPELALALSLLKRAREVVLAVLALMSWKLVELNHWRRARFA